MITKSVLIILISYLIGSIPTSVWVGRLFYGVDIRAHGSGNAGGTNMFRVLGWKPGLIVFLVDVSKGLVPVWVIDHWLTLPAGNFRLYLQLLAGAFAVLGHVWPVLAGFRGGKGIATLTGSLLVLNPQSVIVGSVVFVLVLALTRYVSLSSLMAVLSFPCTLLISRMWFDQNVPNVMLAASGLALPFVLFTHRSNIKRLLTGVENKIGKPAVAVRQVREEI